MEYQQEREQLATAARRLAAEGLVHGTAGNASVRVGEVALVTPTGAVLGDIAPADISAVDVESGEVRAGPSPTSELAIHLRAMRTHGAGAVVHTHSPKACAAGCVVEELPVVHYAMTLFGGPVRATPYLTFGTPELAEAALAALEGRSAALLSNHGAIVLGEDIGHAVDLARLLE
ncbi:MAG: class II aldolase/adducin family protein, partial [Thermoleophilaceae bacterium]|nr:class II aldolase/adducin family protein [Thermoleophilaceae bacterium]